MAPVLALLIVIAAWDCVRSALRYSAQDYQRSRQKAAVSAGKAGAGRRWKTGYWASETLRGFPVARAGWHAGWLSHKTARDHHRARREEARTLHLQTRASFLSGIREHRMRQAEAQAEIDQATAEAPAWDRRTVQKVADELARKRAEKEGQAGPPPAPPLPADGVRPEPGPHASASTAEHVPPGHQNGTTPPPPPATERTHMEKLWDAPLPGGTTMAADVTYDQLMAEAQKVINEAEAEVARLRMSQIGNMVEGMAGMVHDSRSLSRAAEIDEALRQQIKAAEQVLDAAQAFRDGLRRDHGGMNEAHQSAPVKGAQPEFYEG